MGSQVDLMRSEVEKSGMLLGEGPDSDGMEYSPGLTMTLGKPELDKLGLSKPEVGKKYNVTGVMKVTGFNEENNGATATVVMTSLGIDNDEDRVDSLYGG